MNHNQFNLQFISICLYKYCFSKSNLQHQLILPWTWFFLPSRSFQGFCASNNGWIQHPRGDEVVHGDHGASACCGKSSRQWRTCTVACHGCWDWISGDIFQWQGSAIDFHQPPCTSLALDTRSSCFLIDQYDWILMVCMYMLLSLCWHYFFFLSGHIDMILNAFGM